MRRHSSLAEDENRKRSKITGATESDDDAPKFGDQPPLQLSYNFEVMKNSQVGSKHMELIVEDEDNKSNTNTGSIQGSIKK